MPRRAGAGARARSRTIASMRYRALGRTGWNVSTVSFGAWAIGGTWGPVDDAESMAALHRALDLGVNFFDTADVYGDGRSERLLARLKRERSEPFYRRDQGGPAARAACGRGYNRENLTAFIERSLRTSRPKRSTSCSFTVRRRRSTTGPRFSACSTISSEPARSATTA